MKTKHYNNRAEIKISEQFLSYLKSDLKTLRMKSKHDSFTQLMRYALIEVITKTYGEKWLFNEKNSQIPEVKEYLFRQRNGHLESRRMQEKIRAYVDKRKKGITDFNQLGLFTEN